MRQIRNHIQSLFRGTSLTERGFVIGFLGIGLLTFAALVTTIVAMTDCGLANTFFYGDRLVFAWLAGRC